jgi:cytochrome b subunit of formate dehydrogenase
MRVSAVVRSLACALAVLVFALLPVADGAAQMSNEVCLGCHGAEGFAIPGADKKPRLLHVAPGPFEKSVHGKLECAMCHADVTAVPHDLQARPKVDCGTCHAEQKDQYLTSVHGKEAVEKGNPKAATCASCHSVHAVLPPKSPAGKLAIIKNCGGCHKENYESYTDTYHGQVSVLGFSYTAMCFSCHGSHEIQRVKDPASMVAPGNRLKTCQQCHANATPGFVTFEPHANAHDFARYPHVWLATKSMVALLAGVFLFFWTHTALWFYREYKDRQARKSRPHVMVDDTLELQGRHFQRFKIAWRIAHLFFALSVMTLVLTGMAVQFAELPLSKAVMNAFGSPKVAGYVHRIAAAVMLGIFFLHLVHVVVRIGRNLGTWNWFGPTSFVPNLQDAKDAVAMFKWFFGLGPRPMFDRWTYWEKFDYWAVFWGMFIIGGSGLLLWFPMFFAKFLPGWMFNVATLVHGEEALLAVGFIFTIHFFNGHLRPEKFPMDTVIFTGRISEEELKDERAVQYERLQREGALAGKEAPAPTLESRAFGWFVGGATMALGIVAIVLIVYSVVLR